MSLKGFHIVFITFAVLFSFGFCAWTMLAPDDQVTPFLKIIGVISAIAGVLLAIYGVKFIQKTKGLLV